MNSIPQRVNMGGTHGINGMNGIADIMKTQM
jgi:hypothetical protein